LDQLNVCNIEVDCEFEGFWQVRPAAQVDKISQAQGWNLPIKITKQPDTAAA